MVGSVVCAARARDSTVGAKISSGLLACCPVAHAPSKQPTPPPPARSPIARDGGSAFPAAPTSILEALVAVCAVWVTTGSATGAAPPPYRCWLKTRRELDESGVP